MTLYRCHKDNWTKYENQMKLFEEDLVRNKAPIPPSGKFLLVHQLQKLLYPEKPLNPNSETTTPRGKHQPDFCKPDVYVISGLTGESTILLQKAFK
jgi:hypothetical protein